MKRFIWVNGRLAWPLVIVAAYLSASLILLDYVWRIVVMPFDTLLVYSTVIYGLLAVFLFTLYIVFRRVRSAQR